MVAQPQNLRSSQRLHMYQVYFQFCRGKHAERKKVVRSTNVCLPRSTGLSTREHFRLEDENSNTRWIGVRNAVQNENSTWVIKFMRDIGQEGGDTTFANLLPDFCPCPNLPLSANQAEGGAIKGAFYRRPPSLCLSGALS